jgi:hypothetical protein
VIQFVFPVRSPPLLYRRVSELSCRNPDQQPLFFYPTRYSLYRSHLYFDTCYILLVSRWLENVWRGANRSDTGGIVLDVRFRVLLRRPIMKVTVRDFYKK